jgi:hypothetical protein
MEPTTAPCRTVSQPCVWGGYATSHFGHLIADQLTRVLESRVNRPDDLILFVLRPGGEAADVPDVFWQCLAWYGVGPEQVQFVTEPLLVSDLRCFAQAEPIASSQPCERYLDLLHQNAEARGLVPVPSDLTYVGRMGLLAMGKGGAAGETYLVKVLMQAGVRILDPLKASLREQLAVYSGARALVFAEGSAVHGRQLLGRLEQSIWVLNRRKGARIAAPAIEARCRALTYVEACSQTIGMRGMASKTGQVIGLALYDIDRLFAGFAEIGLDLTVSWDQTAFDAAVSADAETWLAGLARNTSTAQFDLENAIRDLQAAGVKVTGSEAG